MNVYKYHACSWNIIEFTKSTYMPVGKATIINNVARTRVEYFQALFRAFLIRINLLK